MLYLAGVADIALMYIQPGNPQQNVYIERYNRTVRTEWLGRYHFDSIEMFRIIPHAGSGLTTMNAPTWEMEE